VPLGWSAFFLLFGSPLFFLGFIRSLPNAPNLFSSVLLFFSQFLVEFLFPPGLCAKRGPPPPKNFRPPPFQTALQRSEPSSTPNILPVGHWPFPFLPVIDSRFPSHLIFFRCFVFFPRHFKTQSPFSLAQPPVKSAPNLVVVCFLRFFFPPGHNSSPFPLSVFPSCKSRQKKLFFKFLARTQFKLYLSPFQTTSSRLPPSPSDFFFPTWYVFFFLFLFFVHRAPNTSQDSHPPITIP